MCVNTRMTIEANATANPMPRNIAEPSVSVRTRSVRTHLHVTNAAKPPPTGPTKIHSGRRRTNQFDAAIATLVGNGSCTPSPANSAACAGTYHRNSQIRNKTAPRQKSAVIPSTMRSAHATSLPLSFMTGFPRFPLLDAPYSAYLVERMCFCDLAKTIK